MWHERRVSAARSSATLGQQEVTETKDLMAAPRPFPRVVAGAVPPTGRSASRRAGGRQEIRPMPAFMPCHPARARGRAVVALVALFVVLIVPPARAQTPRTVPLDALDRMNQSIDALTRKVWPSVVQVLVTSYGAREENVRGDTGAVVG